MTLASAQTTLAEIRATSYYKTWMDRVKNGTKGKTPSQWQAEWVTTHLYKAEQAAIQTIADFTSTPPPPPPPPVPSGPIFGHHKVSQNTTLAYTQKEVSEMVACGGQAVRTDYALNDNGSPKMAAIRASGIPHMSLIVGGSSRTIPDPNVYAALAVQTAKDNPGAHLEWMNEPGIQGWTAADCERVWGAAGRAVRAAGLKNIMLLGAISGSEEGDLGSEKARQWCRDLVAAGVKAGEHFDWANFHLYGDPSVEEAGWMHYWTKGSDGDSCLSILGVTDFAVTEFGAPLVIDKIKNTTRTEAQACAILQEWVTTLRAQPGCRLATWYALSDDAGGSGKGYGLSVPAQGWARRSTFEAYRKAVVG